MRKLKAERIRCRRCPYHTALYGIWMCGKEQGRIVKSPPGPAPKGRPYWCRMEGKEWKALMAMGGITTMCIRFVKKMSDVPECDEIRIGGNVVYKRKEEKHDES